MSDTDLKVVIKAKELMKHTYVLTSNPNRYPKKYRHSLVDRLQLKSMDIYENLLEANREKIKKALSIHPKSEKLDGKLLNSIVKKIRYTPSKTIEMELINGYKISGGEPR